MKLRRSALLALFVGLLWSPGLSSAQLGVIPGLPQFAYDSSGTVSYDAVQGLMTIEATPLFFRLVPGPPILVNETGSPPAKMLKFQLRVDQATGALIGGVAGDDFVLKGEVSDGTIDYTGVLLAGEVLEYGVVNEAVTDSYEFRFAVTGGSLASLFTDQEIGVLLTSEGSTFTGDFTVPFGGGAKGALGPVEPRAFCALSVKKQGCVIPPPPVPSGNCQGKVIRMTMEYTGAGCSASSHSQDPKKVRCTGGSNFAQDVTIIATDKKGKKLWTSANNVMLHDTFAVDSANAGHDTTTGDTLIRVVKDNALIEEVKFHTSCSQPLNVGNQFGSFLLREMTTTGGGQVSLSNTTPPADCNSELPIVAPPHCLGKVKVLKLRYNGGDCTQTLHTQADGKVVCTGNAGTNEPVRIHVSDGGSKVYLDQSGVLLGQVLDVIATNGGRNELAANTTAKIFDANGDLLQQIVFHTSCSQPLNLGDRFGSLQVFAMDTTQGGTSSLGAEVEYLYEILNNSSAPLTNVTAFDDMLGQVPGSPIASIGPGESHTLSTTAFVYEPVTNTVVISGNLSSGSATLVCEATASATITREEPPPPAAICTTKVQAMLLQYIGPDTAGATVEIIPDKFSSTPVAYSPIDLVSGATTLSKPVENGFTIDATAHGQSELGAKTRIRINGVEEVIHTSCSTPFEAGKPAPLDNPKGAPSPNWFVVNLTQK